MNNEWKKIQITPVGTVSSELKELSLVAAEGGIQRSGGHRGRSRTRTLVSEIVIAEEFADCLDGVEDFSHLLVLYWSHMLGGGGREVKQVHPAGRTDLPLVGVFATRSPARPNPVCVTTVELVEREGNVLRVRGLDAVDGSPVIDIKSYNPLFDRVEGARLSGWMEELMRTFAESDGT